MKTVINTITAVFVMLVSLVMTVSCDRYNYVEELQGLGSRVEILEQMVSNINTDLNALQTLIRVVDERGYVSQVVLNSDSSYTIRFNNDETITIRNGRQGVDGKDGKDGQEAEFLISVMQDTDRYWYWTLNGEWILDGDGNKMRAGATDGKDGLDGKDGQNNPEQPAIVPQVRINNETRHWEISTDGGYSWDDTGVMADGKDGIDGKDGQDGQPDVFLNITETGDGKSIIFVLSDGRTFIVPIVQDE